MPDLAQDLQFSARTPTIRNRNRPAKQVGDQRWLNQHSMNRGSTRQSVLCAVSASPECLMNRGELHRLRTGSPAHHPRPSGPDSTFLADPFASTPDSRMPYPCSGASSPLPHRSDSHPVLRRGGRAGRVAGAVPGSAHGAHRRRRCRHRCGISASGLFAALAAQRLLLVAANWSDLRRHPAWLLGLAMVHHPLLAARGRAGGRGLRRALCALAEAAASGPRPMRWPRRWPWAWPSSNWARCWPARVTAPRPAVALGRHLHRSAGRAAGAARRSAFRCIPCRPMRRWLSYALDLAAGLAAARAPAGRCGRAGSDGRRRRHLTSPNSGAIPRAAARCCAARSTGRRLRPFCWCLPGRWCCCERKSGRLPTRSDEAAKGRGTALQAGRRGLHMIDRARIDVPAEAAGPAPRSLSRRATRRREPLARATAHRPGRRAGERRARKGLAQAARRRANLASPASRIPRRSKPCRRRFPSTWFMKTTIWPW